MKQELEQMLRPVWNGGEVYRETFAMIEESGGCRARFYYLPEKILRVESYDGKEVYEEGRDWKTEGGFLVRTENSRMPSVRRSYFYHDTEETAQKELEERPEPLGFGPVQAEDGTYVRLSGVGAPSFVTDCQVAVTYRTEESWRGNVPGMEGGLLPRFSGRLRRREDVKIVFYGDSISCGYDCSGMYGLNPGQPVWPELTAEGLEAEYGVKVRWSNVSVGGVDTDWAAEHAREKLDGQEPDLVILGFGMNDRCRGREYQEKTKRLIDAVRKEAPQAELVLIATSLPNPLLHTPPFYFCGYQEEQGEVLQELRQTGIAVADVQAVQRELMNRKRYLDLTGNLLNHPNDYLARIQAQVVLETLKTPERAG